MGIDYFGNLEQMALQKANVSQLKQNVHSLQQDAKTRKLKKLKKACLGFEAIFLEKLWQQMRKTVPKAGYLHPKQEDMYLSMFDHELANVLAKDGGIGLAEMMFEQLKEQVSNRLDKIPKDKSKLKPIAPLHPSQIDRLQHLKPLKPLKPQNRPLSNLDLQVERLAQKIEAEAGPGKGGLPQFVQPELEKIIPPPTKELEPTSFVWPVQRTRISSNFGWRIDPFTGLKAWHSGIDLAVPVGTPVKACMSGKVVFAGPKAGYGNLVIIEHKNGLKSYYGHNSKLLVKKGEFVRFGQKIALSGNSGRSTGPHLHFELRDGDLALNPLRWQKVFQAKLLA